DDLVRGQAGAKQLDGPTKPKCTYCKDDGHLIAACPKKLAMKCFNCGHMGHISKFCKSPRSNKPSQKYAALSVEPVDPVNKFTFEAQVDGQTMEMLLDTGAKTSVLPKSKVAVDAAAGKKQFGTADKSSNFEARGP